MITISNLDGVTVTEEILEMRIESRIPAVDPEIGRDPEAEVDAERGRKIGIENVPDRVIVIVREVDRRINRNVIASTIMIVVVIREIGIITIVIEITESLGDDCVVAVQCLCIFS